MQTLIIKTQINNFLGEFQSPITLTGNCEVLGWGMRNESDTELAEKINVRQYHTSKMCVSNRVI